MNDPIDHPRWDETAEETEAAKRVVDALSAKVREPEGAATKSEPTSSRLVVRDHSQPCKHGWQIWHLVKDANTTDGDNDPHMKGCPGGKKIVLKRIECPMCQGWNDECVLQHDGEGRVWVEVSE